MEKKAFLTKERAEALAAKYGTPIHVYDEAGIRSTARALKEAFSWNKDFKEYFAVKATPNPYLIGILREEGCGVDCASLAELLLVQRMGFSGRDIMFSSNVTPKEDFVLADKMNAIINFDDVSLIPYYKEIGCKFHRLMCVRYNPGGNFTLNNAIMDTPSQAKYGMTDEQMEEAFRMLKAEGVEEVGIHAFLASNTTENGYYPKLASILFEKAAELQKKTGLKVKFINLSGGIGIPYRPDQTKSDIHKIGEGVREAYERILTPCGMGDVAIFTELGRYMLGPNGALLSRVLHKKDIHKQYVGLDACASNLMRPMMYKAYHHITVLGKEKEPLTHVYDVTGGLCENSDKFAVDRNLPEIEIGDLLFIHDAGAHGHAMGYNYNGKLRSAEVLLTEDGGDRLIRRAETPEDYFRTLDMNHLPYRESEAENPSVG